MELMLPVWKMNFLHLTMLPSSSEAVRMRNTLVSYHPTVFHIGTFAKTLKDSLRLVLANIYVMSNVAAALSTTEVQVLQNVRSMALMMTRMIFTAALVPKASHHTVRWNSFTFLLKVAYPVFSLLTFPRLSSWTLTIPSKVIHTI